MRASEPSSANRKRVLAIYQECRTPAEIDAAFHQLQAEMDEQIRTRLDDTRRKLFEHFDEDVHQRLRLQLADNKEQIKALRRQATTLEEQHQIQEKIQKLERQQRRQRQEIFKVEDEIMEKRDALVESLEKRLAQRSESETLFTIRWAVE